MRNILVTGASGFIGKNLCSRLKLLNDVNLLEYTRSNSQTDLIKYVKKADFIFHIAGVNRPQNESEYKTDNKDLTELIIKILDDNHKITPIIFTSSAQAELDNPYGKSKAAAEEILLKWANRSNSPVYVYRLPGIFGKWCRPNYNSVVATFCHNIANNLPTQVSDPQKVITISYIDDVIDEFVKQLDKKIAKSKNNYYSMPRTYGISLGELRDKIVAIHDSRTTLVVPNLEDTLTRYLYATYVSYLDKDNFSYCLTMNTDERGWLSEFIKSQQFGQIFISKTKPGITRGNHWHHTKSEKFLVIDGEGEVSFRNIINNQDVIKYRVSGDQLQVVDIPTGYTHAITNIGTRDLITVFWANEIFDQNHPDTYFEEI